MNYKAKIYYQDKEVANRYFAKRFNNISGSINHYLEKVFLKSCIKSKNIKKAVDVACGTGRLTNELTKLNISDVYGTDISSEMMEVAKDFCENKNGTKLTFVKNDATKLSFNDKQFDLAITFRFLDHLPLNEKEKVIDEMARVSSKYIILTMANKNFITKVSASVRKFFSKNYFEGELVSEKKIFDIFKKNNLALVKRKYKLPILSMEIMYFLKKV